MQFIFVTWAKFDQCKKALHAIKKRSIQYSIRAQDTRSTEACNTLAKVVEVLRWLKLQAYYIATLFLQKYSDRVYVKATATWQSAFAND